jgi:hypothetical protein
MGIENTPPPTGGPGGTGSLPPMTLFDFLKGTFATGNLTLSQPTGAATLDQGGYSLVLTDVRSGTSLSFEMTPLSQFPQLSLPDYARIPDDETGTLNPWLRAAYLPALLSILAEVAAAMAKMKLGDGLNNAALTVQEFNLSVELGEEKREQYQLEAKKLITEAVTQILSGVVSMGMGIFSLAQGPRMMGERAYNRDLATAKDNPSFDASSFKKLDAAEIKLSNAKANLAAEQNKAPAASQRFAEASDNLKAKGRIELEKKAEFEQAQIRQNSAQADLDSAKLNQDALRSRVPPATEIEIRNADSAVVAAQAKLDAAKLNTTQAKNDYDAAKRDSGAALSEYTAADLAVREVAGGPDPEKLKALQKDVNAAQTARDDLLSPGPGINQIQKRIDNRMKEIKSEFDADTTVVSGDRQLALKNKIENDPELGRLRELQTNKQAFVDDLIKNKASNIDTRTQMFNAAVNAMNEAFQSIAKGVSNMIQASITMDIANVAYNQSVTEGAIKVIDATKQVLSESIKNFGEIISNLIQAMLKAETDTTSSFKFQ